MKLKPIPTAIGVMIAFLWIFGVFGGLPLMGWVFLICGTIGHIVYTSHSAAFEPDSDPVTPDRPWVKS
jgi:hypothetical protein